MAMKRLSHMSVGIAAIGIALLGCTSDEPGTGASTASTVAAAPIEPPATTSEPEQAPSEVVADPDTTAPARISDAPPCDENAMCDVGFVLLDQFHVVGCAAIRPDAVTDDVLGAGTFNNMDVTINRIDGVDPDVLVAMNVPGGDCSTDEKLIPSWLAVLPETGVSPRTVGEAMCSVGHTSYVETRGSDCNAETP